MSIMFDDIHAEKDFSEGQLDILAHTEVLYADDTVVITKDETTMSSLLEAIERHARNMGLAFNKTKCNALNFNTSEQASFADGTPVPIAKEVVYLGSILSSTHNHRREVAKRKAAAMATWKRLDIFWKKANCPPKFKLIVLDAVIRSKLVYGLDCIQIPEAALNTLNAFQLKGIRKILGIHTTFVNRANTNQAVFEQATEVRYGDKNRKEHTELEMRSFSQYLHQKNADILGHIIRAEPTDPMRTVSLQPGTNIPRTHENRRVGRPRHHLLISTYERVWKALPQNCVLNDFKAGIRNNIQDVAGRAQNRTGVFAPPLRSKKKN